MRQRTGRWRVVLEKGIGLVVGQTGARHLGRLDGECGGVSEPPCRLAALRTPHRPQPLGSSRWREGAAPSGDAGDWIRGSAPTLSRSTSLQHPGASPGRTAALAPGRCRARHKQVAVFPAPVSLQDLRADSRPVSDYRANVREGLDARLY